MKPRSWLSVIGVLFLSFNLFAADPRIRVLIVDGFSNHDWQQTTALIRGILDSTDLFDVSVSTAPATTNDPAWATWRPKFSAYDVVIQTCNDINHGPSWPEPVKKNLPIMSPMVVAFIFSTPQKMHFSAGRNTKEWSGCAGAKPVTAPPFA